MSDVPDSVIEKAAEAIRVAMVKRNDRLGRAWNRGIDEFEREAGTNGTDRRIAAEAAARVIVKWAREQERERIRALLEDRAKEAGDDYHLDPQAYHRGREDELVMLVEEIEPAGTREDGKL